MRKYKGHTKLVVKPGSTEEVSKVLKYCNDNMLAAVPQGGNSGLVGGSVPVFDEIVINMSRMNKIRDFDEVSGTLVVDAGCILEVADHFLAEKNYIFLWILAQKVPARSEETWPPMQGIAPSKIRKSTWECAWY